jgi:uncharacterized protein (DUF433 family)
MSATSDWLGIGLYTAAETSQLLHLPSAKIRRWLGGYDYVHRGSMHHADPLWTPQLPKLDGQLGLGFLDLMQLRLVSLFIEHGVSLQAIRRALAHAAEVLSEDHPFTAESFKTDGRRIFLEIADETGERKVCDLARRQYAFHRLVAPSFKDVDFEAGVTARWWPMGHRRLVVLDPRRSFGAPIAAKSGIPTATLADVAQGEGSPLAVTRWFPVAEREVQDAIEFERRLVGPPVRQLAA